MTFQTSLRQRLDIIKPSSALISKVLTLRPPTQYLSPNVQQLISLLHSRQKTVYLISGGFKGALSLPPSLSPSLSVAHSKGAKQQSCWGGLCVCVCVARWSGDGVNTRQEMITPVAEHLEIPLDYVYANSLRWDQHGQYASFDPQAYTSTEGGKKRAIEHIRSVTGGGETVIVMIGDGATDLEARDAKDGKGGADLLVPTTPIHPPNHPPFSFCCQPRWVAR